MKYVEVIEYLEQIHFCTTFKIFKNLISTFSKDYSPLPSISFGIFFVSAMCSVLSKFSDQFKFLNNLSVLTLISTNDIIVDNQPVGFSKILNYLLKNHEELTMAFLIGVMLGSLKVPFVEIFA